MIWFMLILALAMAYLVCYTVHCFRRRYVCAAIGAMLLNILPLLLLVAFVSIMLQTS